MTRLLPIAPIAAALLTGCAAADVELACLGDAPLCEINEVVGEDRARAGGLDITRVELYQAVQVDLMDSGEIVTSDVPIVAGREAMVRVFVTPADDWQVRDVAARFYLYQGDAIVGAGEGTARPTTASVAGDLNSTINVRLDGGMLPEGDLTWSVELVEAAPGVKGSGSTRGAVFPDGDPAPITTEWAGDSVRIYLVPVTDGSGATPDTGPGVVDMIRDSVYAMYPTPDVEIEVGGPFEYPQPVQSMGALSPLLQAVGEIRKDESRGIQDDQYIFGLTAFEGGGLSWVGGSPLDAGTRASVGAGWTIPHEVGHASGRPHTPGCGAGRPDTNYPHANDAGEGIIGNYGWDPVSGQLHDPEASFDFMSYCRPRWISDYVWESIFERNQGIAEAYYGEAPDPNARLVTTAWREVWFHADGQVAWGQTLDLRGEPEGETRRVDLLDADGRVIDTVDASWHPFEHLDGTGAGVLLLPEVDRVAAIRPAGDLAVAPVDLIDVIGGPLPR